MITAYPVKYGYLSDIACSIAQVLMFYVYTTPTGLKIYRNLAQALSNWAQLLYRNSLKVFEKCSQLQIVTV